MKVILLRCPACSKGPLAIELPGIFWYVVLCMACGKRFRIPKEDAEDGVIEHE